MTMEIKFDRASKFYEPGDKVTGSVTIHDSSASVVQHVGVVLEAEGYMDTVSMIRGTLFICTLSTLCSLSTLLLEVDIV